MIDFIKTDRFLLLVVVLSLLGLYAMRPTPEILDLLKIGIGGFIGLLRGSGTTQQNFIVPENGIITPASAEMLNRLSKNI